MPPVDTHRSVSSFLFIICVFLLSSVLGGIFIWQAEQDRLAAERARVADLVNNHAATLQTHIDRSLSATYALAALVRQAHGSPPEFDDIARQMLPFYPGVSSLSLAPKGVVQQVFPHQDNTKALGLDLFKDPIQNREAMLSRESGKLTLAGPLTLMQGHLGVVGRLPIFMDDRKGVPVFWGFSMVVMRFPDMLTPVQLPKLVERGFDYTLWRQIPGSKGRQMITTSSVQPLLEPVERHFDVLNGTWVLSVAPTQGWGAPLGLLLRIMACLICSTALASLVYLLLAQRRRQAELARRNAEAHTYQTELARAQAAAHMGSWLLDVPTGLVRCSAEIYRIFGLVQDSPVSSATFYSYVHPDDHQIVRAAWKSALNGTRYDVEYRIVINQQTRWLHNQARLSYAPNGNLTQAAGILQDITLRKEAEAQILATQSKLQATFDAIPDLLFELDVMGYYHDAHAPHNDLPLLSTADLVGKRVQDVLPAESAEIILAALQEAQATGQSNGKQYAISLPQGAMWFELSVSRKATDHDIPARFIVLSRDISERKRTEAILQSRTQELALHNQVLQQVSQGLPLRQILETLVLEVESQHTDVRCAISLLDDAGTHLNHGAGPSLPDFYNQAINGLTVGEGEGSCGTAAYRGKRMIVEDIEIHPYWEPFRALAYRVGLRACWSQPILNSEGRVLGVFALYHAIPARPSDTDIAQIESYAKLAELAIERRQAEKNLRIAAVAFETQEGIFVTDARYVILRVNQAFTTITGYTTEEAVGQTMYLPGSDRNNASFYDEMWTHIHDTGSWQGELWNRRKNGELYREWLTMTAVTGDDETVSHYVGTLTDVTQRKAAEEQIKQLAYYDPLTRLPNRRLLLDRLRRRIASGSRSPRQGALFFIDLDNFKTLNDSMGHDVGDVLLRQVGERLLASVRETDTVARLGGDEFVVMLDDLGDAGEVAAKQAKKIGEKILAYLNQPYRLVGMEHHSTPSIGITLFSGADQTVEQLLKQSDFAMYQAKAAGRNGLCFFDAAMQITEQADTRLEEELRQALEEGQLRLHYQPQVDEQGKMTGAEVLVRWQHPLRGLIYPNEFIPQAKETGLILKIDQWVLEAACAQLVLWAAQTEMVHLTLAVNISSREFRQPNFVSAVQAILRDTGADPSKLKLEVTESVLQGDLPDIIAKMTALRAEGVRFSLDDFGTGYAVLPDLNTLPLDQLKIGESFVADILTSPNGAAVARTLIALGQNLGLEVIAEGVETEEQYAFLADLGCRAFQGYLFGQPDGVGALQAAVQREI